MGHQKENFLKRDISKQSTEDETYLYNTIRLFYTLLYKISILDSTLTAIQLDIPFPCNIYRIMHPIKKK